MRERVHAGRGHVTRTKRAGADAIPPSLAHGADRPPATGAAAFSDDAKKGEGVHAAHRPPAGKTRRAALPPIAGV